MVSHVWSFGDGGLSNSVNPVHNYTLAGIFPVSLKVTDNNGCENTKQIPNYIQVYPLPNAVFNSNSVRISCTPPLNVTFINNSTGTGSLTYLWDFGDGNSSTLTNPTHTYTTFGTFNVSLKVTDNNSCSKTTIIPGYVKIQPLIADFTTSKDSVCLGDTILFFSNSQNAQTYQWNFGDNTTGAGVNIPHVYQDSGWFEVRLIAIIPASGCRDTVYKDVYVEQVVANFTVEPSYICELPDSVVYQNNSVNWDFRLWKKGFKCPNGVSSNTQCGKGDTLENVVYTHFLLDGIYADTLIVESLLGCVDTMIRDTSVIVNRVAANAILSQAVGCRPYIITFTNNSRPYNPAVYSPPPLPVLTSYEWIIDDTLYSNLAQPPNLSITDTGLWLGSLKVVNSLGCENTMLFDIRAGDSVTADFLILDDTVCVNEFDSAISLSQDTNYITSYNWFTVPSSGQIINGQSVAFLPKSIGYYSVGLIVEHHGCADTLVEPLSFYADGPIMQFYSTLFDCSDSTTINFISYMQQASSWMWDFGDTLVPKDSVSINPTVVYPKVGTYQITLTGYNSDSSCSHSYSRHVIANRMRALILTDTMTKDASLSGFSIRDTVRGCAPLTVHFTAGASPGAMKSDWYINGVPYLNMNPDSFITVTFNQRGFYDVTLVVSDTVANCYDTTHMVVASYKPIVDFIGNPNKGCLPLNVLLEENVSTLNKIVEFKWLVGSIIDSTPDFSHVFSSQVELDARLIAIDSFGCSDTLVREDYILSSNFNIDFYATNTTNLCEGDSLKFVQSMTISNVSLTWVFEPGDTVKAVEAWHIFPDSGKFDVLLIGKDSVGCSKEVLKTDFVSVQKYPVAEFSADPRDSTCYPLGVQFYADSSMVYFNENSYYYILGDYSAASNYKDPFHNYVRPGSYTITLVVETTHGCIDSITKPAYVNIGGPYAEIHFEPDSICRGDSVQFQLGNVINLKNFGWDFGDGSSILNVNPVYHVYTDSIGQVYPTLFFDDSSGACSKTFTDTLYIFENVAEFTISDTIGCIPYSPIIGNLSVGSSSYKWDFGEGTTSTLKDPTITYPNPGRYRIELLVSGLGCMDSAFKIIDVFPLPIANAKSDTLICEGDSVQLYSSGGEFYLWSPSNGLNNSALQNPIAYPEISTGYEVKVTDTNGCVNFDEVLITVQNPIKLNLQDLILIVGDTLTLKDAYGGKGVSYKWIPSTGLSCDTCARPRLTALESGTYTLLITDTNNCFETGSTFYLEVENKYTLDVPEAFTPNGDGVNDIIYVRGWGLKELITFKIYNRWGELVFESDRLDLGWDGLYKGKLQGVETYVYFVEALTYGNQVLKKKGNIDLLR